MSEPQDKVATLAEEIYLLRQSLEAGSTCPWEQSGCHRGGTLATSLGQDGAFTDILEKY